VAPPDVVAMTSSIFQAEAERAFQFLCDAGFTITDRAANALHYENARSFVTISWDPRSGELNLYVGIGRDTGEPNDRFTLTDLLAMEKADLPEASRPFQVADEGALRGCIERLANDLRLYGQPVMTADPMYFRCLRTFRTKQSRIYMRDMELRRVRAEAETAWRKRDFPAAARLFNSMMDDLTDAERAKLEYSNMRRHSKDAEE